jgi:multiple sugar transport system substrate-binding protein
VKCLFPGLILLLSLAGVALNRSLPDTSSPVPVIYWVTDANPARDEQVRLFHAWLAKNNLPRVELRLDTSNNDDTKKIIQGVSGVGGDIMDLYTGSTMRYYQAIGLLKDVTDAAQAKGFDLSRTYPTVAPEITVEQENGELHQYMFPCNVVATLYFVNKETLAAAGITEIPPVRWTAAEFERWGKRFVAAANKPGARQRSFWVDAVDPIPLYRGAGASELNETCTAAAIDDARVAESYRLIYRWTFVDRLIPSSADHQSFSASSGYGGSTPQLFNNGTCALLLGGRHLFIQFREFDKGRAARGEPLMNLAAVEPPFFEGGLPNIAVGTRAASVYAGSDNQDAAVNFLAFLASEDYNMQVVRDGDSLPPNPRYAETEAFLRPPDHLNEWGVHEVFATAATDIAIGGSYSPFILPRVVVRETSRALDEVMNDRLAPEEALRQANDRINQGIARTLAENPKLRPQYEKLVDLQKQIEAARAQGRKVPKEWLKNPLHRAYYQFKGWSE